MRSSFWIAIVLLSLTSAVGVAAAQPARAPASASAVQPPGEQVITPRAAEPVAEETATPEIGKKRVPTGWEVAKGLLGVLVILVFAFLAGHPRVQEIEELIGISAVVGAGLPFVLFGLIANHPAIGLLSDSVRLYIQPFLPLGLGWIGFSIGFRFDIKRLDTLPRGVGAALFLTSVVPFAAIVGACSVILLISGGVGQGTFLRDSIILGTAAIIGLRPPPPNLEGPTADRIAPILQLQEGCAMIGLILVAAFFRPGEDQVGWQVPAIAWIFVTLGMGTALGAIIYAILNTFKRGAEMTILMLGSICLVAGMSSFLRLSPIAVCFIAGALIMNVPGTWKDQARVALVRLERPIYLVFLVVAGAMWQVGAWQGWVLLLLFVAGRLIGKVLGVFVSQQRRLGEQLNIELGELNQEEQVRIALAPMGALAIAIVVNAQDLYTGSTVSWMVTTVIGGAVVTEITTKLILKRLYPNSYALTPASALVASPSGLAPPPREQTPLPFPLARAATPPTAPDREGID